MSHEKDETLARELTAKLTGEGKARLREATELLRDFRDNYDHDADAHRYNSAYSQCRCCKASAFLAAPKPPAAEGQEKPPSMTDLMVTPESLDAYLAANPPPAPTVSEEPQGERHKFERKGEGGCGRYLGGDPSKAWAFCGKPESDPCHAPLCEKCGHDHERLKRCPICISCFVAVVAPEVPKIVHGTATTDCSAGIFCKVCYPVHTAARGYGMFTPDPGHEDAAMEAGGVQIEG